MAPTVDLFSGMRTYLARPSYRKFYIYLGLLWILNIADVSQTLMLKYDGNLVKEANTFIDYFLLKGPFYFVAFKGLAVLLVTLMLIRGYNHPKGVCLGDTCFTREQTRTAIVFLLLAGIIYYLIVVYIPLVVTVASFKAMGKGG